MKLKLMKAYLEHRIKLLESDLKTLESNSLDELRLALEHNQKLHDDSIRRIRADTEKIRARTKELEERMKNGKGKE